MLTLALKNRISRSVAWSPSLSSKERMIIRVMISVFILDAIGYTFLIKNWFFSDTSSYATAIAAYAQPGDATNDFIIELKNEGLNPFMSRKTTRAPFSVLGVIIGINNKDNIQVFEYDNHEAAMKDEAMLMAKYAASTVPNVWKDSTHIYVKDNLLIFYLGKDPDILLALNKNQEFSLDTPPIALTR